MNAAQRLGFRIRHIPSTNAYRSALRLGAICTTLAGLAFVPLVGPGKSLFSLSGLAPDGPPRSHSAECSSTTKSRNPLEMRRKTPTHAGHIPGAAVLRMAAGETVHIGPDVQIHLTRTSDGRAVMSIWAPKNYDIDRSKNFKPAQNSDGQGAPTPQPSAK